MFPMIRLYLEILHLQYRLFLKSWEEGNGVDLDNYTDLTYDGTGSNWINARASSSSGTYLWDNQGGDF